MTSQDLGISMHIHILKVKHSERIWELVTCLRTLQHAVCKQFASPHHRLSYLDNGRVRFILLNVIKTHKIKKKDILYVGPLELFLNDTIRPKGLNKTS